MYDFFFVLKRRQKNGRGMIFKGICYIEKEKKKRYRYDFFRGFFILKRRQKNGTGMIFPGDFHIKKVAKERDRCDFFLY